jgi:phage-related protein
MTDVGKASVEVEGDVRNFARQTEADLNKALSRIDLDDVEIDVDQDHARRSGEQAGRAVSDGASKGVEGSRGRFSSALKKAFTPSPGLFDALRAPFAAAFSTPIVGAVLSVAGVAAIAFVGAFAAALATAGLGAVFLGIGAAALFGAKKSRDEAQKDLDAAEERVRKAEQRAQSGTAASKRSLADARAELAKAQEAVANNAAFTKLDASLGKLADTLKRVGQAAAAPLIKPFTDAINTLGKAVERIGPLLRTIFAGLAPAIGPLTEGIAGFVEEFLKVLTADPSTLQGMRDALIALGANLPRLGTALGGLFALFASNENNVRNIGLLFGLLDTALSQLGATIILFSTILDGLIIGWNAVGAAISTAVGWITGTAVPAITGAASAVGAFFQAIPGVISGAWTAIVGFFSGIISTIGGFISSVGSSVVSFFTNLPGQIVAVLAALPGFLISFFTGAISSVAYVVGFGIGSIVAFFAALPTRIVGALVALVGLVSGVFNSTVSTARSIVSAGVTAVVSFFAQLPNRVRSAISGIIGAITSVFSSARSSAVSQSSSLVSGAINVIRTLPQRISSALSSVRSAVVGAFAGAGGWLVGAGRSIIQGLANGITGAMGAAISAARAAAARVVAGFKDALRIGSPSKLMNLEVGRMIPAGVAGGIEDNAGVIDTALRKALGGLTTDLPSFTSPSGSRAQGGDGASALGQSVQLTIMPGAIVVQGQGREAGEEAAEAILERLGAATLVR